MDGWFRERVRRAEFHVKSSKIFCNISVLIPPIPPHTFYFPTSQQICVVANPEEDTPFLLETSAFLNISHCVSSLLLLLMLVLLYNALVSNLSSFDVCSHLAS